MIYRKLLHYYNNISTSAANSNKYSNNDKLQSGEMAFLKYENIKKLVQITIKLLLFLVPISSVIHVMVIKMLSMIAKRDNNSSTKIPVIFEEDKMLRTLGKLFTTTKSARKKYLSAQSKKNVKIDGSDKKKDTLFGGEDLIQLYADLVKDIQNNPNYSFHHNDNDNSLNNDKNNKKTYSLLKADWQIELLSFIGHENDSLKS